MFRSFFRLKGCSFAWRFEFSSEIFVFTSFFGSAAFNECSRLLRANVLAFLRRGVSAFSMSWFLFLMLVIRRRSLACSVSAFLDLRVIAWRLVHQSRFPRSLRLS